MLVGNDTNINAATLLSSGLTFSYLGESIFVVLNSTMSLSYIFVRRITSGGNIALQAVEPLASGEGAGVNAGRHARGAMHAAWRLYCRRIYIC